jgi:hypothetical protein
LQISEATLLPGGLIDQHSIKWRDVSPIDVEKSSKNEDYHEMSAEERMMNLDDLHAKDEHLVTGVRFQKVGSHLNFEILTTPFVFATGKLIPDRSEWVSKDNTNIPKTELHLDSPDIPTNGQPSKVDSKDDQFVRFGHTDYTKDAAQTTVPFIDIQSVISNIPVPLTGAGIYHKGQKGYGGFIAPKIFTYDYFRHIEPLDDDIEIKISPKNKKKTEIDSYTPVDDTPSVDTEEVLPPDNAV